MSYAAKILEQKGATKQRIYYLQSTFAGENVYYFLAVDPLKEAYFLKQMKKNDPIDLTTFGKMLKKGYGVANAAIKKEMTERYGIVFKEEP